jgi:hypothetical protein
MIQHFSNILNKFYLEDLQAFVRSPEIAWSHFEETAGGYNGNFSWVTDHNTEEIDLFTGHPNKDKISYEPLTYRLSELIGCRIDIERIKLNMLLPPQARKNSNAYNRPHVDYPELGMKTFLIYLNDCDGDTVIFDKVYTGQDPLPLSVIEKITPKANTAILFDSNRYHASSIPTKGNRFVINVVFWEPGYKEKYHLEKCKDMQVPFDPLPSVFAGTSHIKDFFQKK